MCACVPLCKSFDTIAGSWIVLLVKQLSYYINAHNAVSRSACINGKHHRGGIYWGIVCLWLLKVWQHFLLDPAFALVSTFLGRLLYMLSVPFPVALVLPLTRNSITNPKPKFQNLFPMGAASRRILPILTLGWREKDEVMASAALIGVPSAWARTRSPLFPFHLSQ